MAIGVTLLILSVLIIGIWILFEIKRLKHKLFAIFLIALILVGYFSISFSLRGQNIDLKTIPGIIEASNIYLNFLGYSFKNMRVLTTNAVQMDWKINESSE